MTDPEPEDPIRATARLMARARSVLAYGGLDGVVHRPLLHATGTFPQFAARAEGCRLWDTTGNELVDWSNGWGPVLLGYRHPAVEAAIVAQLAAGPTVSLIHPVEVEVAELICELVPSAEAVAFGKNGSDAVAAAVRVARAATGRDVIVHHGFHGYHDWYLAEHPDVQGIPAVLGPLVASFPYGDLEALAAVLDRHRGSVAAVLMEPLNTFPPPAGYLEGVRELAHAHGALLVFDEVLTGFRTSRGGAQEAYGVLPDLTCLGKAMGNGMPLSALAGPRALMQRVPSVGYGITFRGETLSLAAARAVLTTIRDEPVNEHLASVGETMRAGLERLAADAGLPCRALGHPSRLTIGFEPTEHHGWPEVRERFLQACLRHGVLTTGVLLPSYAHDDVAVARSLEAMGAALEDVAEQLATASAPSRPRFGGSPDGPRTYRATGFLEVLDVDAATVPRTLRLVGWVLVDDRPPASVSIRLPGATPVEAQLRPDRDVERFAIDLPLPDRPEPGDAAASFDLVCCTPAGATWECRVEVADGRTKLDQPLPLDDGVLYL